MHHHHPPLQQPPQHHIHQPPISTRHHQLAIPLQHDLLQRQQQMAQLPSASGDTDPTQDLLAHYLPSSTQAPPASSTDRQPPQQVTDPPNQRAPQVLNPPPPSHSQVNPQAHRPLRHHVNNSGSSVRLGPLLAGIPVVTSGEDYSDDEWSEASLPWTAGRRAPGNGVASQVVAQSAQQPILENRTATATGSDGKTVLVPLPPRTLSIRRDGSSSAALPSTSNPPSAHRPKPSLDSTDMPQFPTCTSTDRSLNPSPPFRNLGLPSKRQPPLSHKESPPPTVSSQIPQPSQIGEPPAQFATGYSAQLSNNSQNIGRDATFRGGPVVLPFYPPFIGPVNATGFPVAVPGYTPPINRPANSSIPRGDFYAIVREPAQQPPLPRQTTPSPTPKAVHTPNGPILPPFPSSAREGPIAPPARPPAHSTRPTAQIPAIQPLPANAAASTMPENVQNPPLNSSKDPKVAAWVLAVSSIPSWEFESAERPTSQARNSFWEREGTLLSEVDINDSVSRVGAAEEHDFRTVATIMQGSADGASVSPHIANILRACAILGIPPSIAAAYAAGLPVDPGLFQSLLAQRAQALLQALPQPPQVDMSHAPMGGTQNLSVQPPWSQAPPDAPKLPTGAATAFIPAAYNFDSTPAQPQPHDKPTPIVTNLTVPAVTDSAALSRPAQPFPYATRAAAVAASARPIQIAMIAGDEAALVQDAPAFVAPATTAVMPLRLSKASPQLTTPQQHEKALQQDQLRMLQKLHRIASVNQPRQASMSSSIQQSPIILPDGTTQSPDHIPSAAAVERPELRLRVHTMVMNEAEVKEALERMDTVSKGASGGGAGSTLSRGPPNRLAGEEEDEDEEERRRRLKSLSWRRRSSMDLSQVSSGRLRSLSRPGSGVDRLTIGKDDEGTGNATPTAPMTPASAGLKRSNSLDGGRGKVDISGVAANDDGEQGMLPVGGKVKGESVVIPFASSPVAGSILKNFSFAWESSGFQIKSEMGEVVCIVSKTATSMVKNTYTALDVFNTPICRLSTLDANDRDMALFQNQFGGMYIRRGGVRMVTKRSIGPDKITSQYEITHDVCDVPYRLMVLDAPRRGKQTAILHLKDATTAIAEIRWSEEGTASATCHVAMHGRRYSPTLEVLIAAAVTMRFGVRSKTEFGGGFK